MHVVVLTLLLMSCQVAERERPATAATVAPDSGRVRVAGSTLFYESAGARTPVILLHRGNLDLRMWDAEIVALQRTHRVTRYDARGYVRSGPADMPFSAHDDLRVPSGSRGESPASSGEPPGRADRSDPARRGYRGHAVHSGRRERHSGAGRPRAAGLDIPGVGHMVNLEAPGQFLEAVATFLTL